MRRKCLIIFIAFVSVLPSHVFADDEFYDYPITTESEDWFEYSVQEKHDMLSINGDTLKSMTDEQLVRAIADYPYLVDIFVCDSIQGGLAELKKSCDAYRELASRPSFKESMTGYGSELIQSYSDKQRTDGRCGLVKIALEEIINAIAKENKANLIDRFGERSVLSAPITPNGNIVNYTMPSEPHTVVDLYHDTIDNGIVSTYGVTKVYCGSCQYNCHSYAWHSMTNSNIYWILHPTPYMADGSYTQVFNGSLSASVYNCGISLFDKVYYNSTSFENRHSAVFIDYPNSGVPVATSLVESKWGKAGVFRHAVTNVPSSYDTSNVSIWH